MISPETLKGQIARYYDLVDKRDYESLLALFSNDCIYNRPGYEPLLGKARLAAFYDKERVIESGTHSLHLLLAQENVVATAGKFAGALKSGEDVSVGFAETFEFRDDVIQERTTYFYRPAV